MSPQHFSLCQLLPHFNMSLETQTSQRPFGKAPPFLETCALFFLIRINDNYFVRISALTICCVTWDHGIMLLYLFMFKTLPNKVTSRALVPWTPGPSSTGISLAPALGEGCSPESRNTEKGEGTPVLVLWLCSYTSISAEERLTGDTETSIRSSSKARNGNILSLL